jgi:hypothetical protein
MSRSIGVVAAALIILVQPLATGQDQEFRCNYTRKIECSPEGCQSGDVGSAFLLMPSAVVLFAKTIAADNPEQLPRIRRCDSKGCTSVVVRATSSGAFLNVTQPDGAYFLRIVDTDLKALGGPRLGDFVEVASVFLSTITYYGSCPAVAK